ncbi:MAG: universal stress protein [Chloroflexota bacterium]
MVTPTCLRKILLADDGSEHARAAIQLLQKLPLPADTHITVLRVFGSQQASELSTLEAAVKATCDLLLRQGLQTDLELILGQPAEKIIEYADEHHPDMIVLGAKGLRATLGILLGGVAQQVVEYASCPVLVVRAPLKKLHRVLLVIDSSPYSQLAAECLARFPLPDKAEMRVMHVLPPQYQVIATEMPYGHTFEQPLMITEEIARQRATEEEEGHRLLERMAGILAAGRLPVKTVLKRGDAATEIIAYVQKNQVDLIVAGSRGLSQMRSWLLGSVSRKLVHYSNCSVLVVRKSEP